MAKQLRNSDKAMQQIQPVLTETFNEFVVIGLRKLENHEQRKVDETTERPYWFISGSPVLGGALIQWALENVMLQLKKGGVLTKLDEGELKPERLEEIIKELVEEP